VGYDRKKSLIREAFIDKHLDFLGFQKAMKQNFTKSELRRLCGGFFFGWQWSPP
jgi:hypothetical protein